MTRWWAALGVATVLALSACGGAGDDLSEATTAQLESQVAAIRAAAVAGDRPGAEAAVAKLRTTVTQLEQAGDMSAERARDVLAAAAAVEIQLGLLPAPTTTTAPPPPPADQEERKDDDEEQQKDEEQKDGKGKKGGDGD